MNESRKQFEEWVIGIYGYVTVIRKVNGTQEYSLSEIDKMWKAWQASRQALGVKND